MSRTSSVRRYGQAHAGWQGVLQRTGCRIGLAALLLVALPVGTRGSDLPAGLDSLEWLRGCWRSTDGGPAIEECWSSVRGNLMLGYHVEVDAAGRTFFEYLRISLEDETPTYWASPMGRPATPFPLAEAAPGLAVFESPGHDWPQRLTYRRDGDRLHVRAEGLDPASRQLDWTWRHAPPFGD